jgi:hypothetical protein
MRVFFSCRDGIEHRNFCLKGSETYAQMLEGVSGISKDHRAGVTSLGSGLETEGMGLLRAPLSPAIHSGPRSKRSTNVDHKIPPHSVGLVS